MKPVLSALGTIAMAVALVGSSVALVYVNHARRASFVELQALERERDAIQIEWGQLKLEQSTWATSDRVGRVARERLGLRAAPADAIVLVEP